MFLVLFNTVSDLAHLKVESGSAGQGAGIHLVSILRHGRGKLCLQGGCQSVGVLSVSFRLLLLCYFCISNWREEDQVGCYLFAPSQVLV